MAPFLTPAQTLNWHALYIHDGAAFSSPSSNYYFSSRFFKTKQIGFQNIVMGWLLALFFFENIYGKQKPQREANDVLMDWHGLGFGIFMICRAVFWWSAWLWISVLQLLSISWRKESNLGYRNDKAGILVLSFAFCFHYSRWVRDLVLLTTRGQGEKW